MFYFFFTNQAAGVLGRGDGRAGKPGRHTKIEVRREGGKKAEGFFFSSSLPASTSLFGLKHLSALRLAGRPRAQRVEGPGMQRGPAQE